MFKKSLILGIVLFAGLTVGAFALNEVIHVHNLSGYELSSMYITPIQSSQWGEDLLAGQPLPDGDTTDVGFTIVKNYWVWDMRATDMQGDTVVWRNLNIQGIKDIYLWVDRNGTPEVRLYQN